MAGQQVVPFIAYAQHARAAAAGATMLRPPAEPGIGHRVYAAEDLEGHRWMHGQAL